MSALLPLLLLLLLVAALAADGGGALRLEPPKPSPNGFHLYERAREHQVALGVVLDDGGGGGGGGEFDGDAATLAFDATLEPADAGTLTLAGGADGGGASVQLRGGAADVAARLGAGALRFTPGSDTYGEGDALLRVRVKRDSGGGGGGGGGGTDAGDDAAVAELRVRVYAPPSLCTNFNGMHASCRAAAHCASSAVCTRSQSEAWLGAFPDCDESMAARQCCCVSLDELYKEPPP